MSLHALARLLMSLRWIYVAAMLNHVSPWVTRSHSSMSTRADSQHSQYTRRRSNTAQSIVRNLPHSPLRVGDTKVFNLWVDDTKESVSVLFNQTWWPGVLEGDMLRVTGLNSDFKSGFLFVVPKDDGNLKPQLQVRVKRFSETLYLTLDYFRFVSLSTSPIRLI